MELDLIFKLWNEKKVNRVLAATGWVGPEDRFDNWIRRFRLVAAVAGGRKEQRISQKSNGGCFMGTTFVKNM